MPFKDPKARNAYLAIWRARNREATREASRAFRLRNLEALRSYQRDYQLSRYHAIKKHDETYKASSRAKAKAWYAANSQKAKKYSTFRRRSVMIARGQAPKWTNWFYVSEIYDIARRRAKSLGIPHEVDHIIPLRGKLVCGLHVETNLQVVPRAVNRAKYNSYQPT